MRPRTRALAHLRGWRGSSNPRVARARAARGSCRDWVGRRGCRELARAGAGARCRRGLVGQPPAVDIGTEHAANGTGTPLAPLSIEATPTPESASIANAKPTSLSATGAQTLFRNAPRVRANQEGRAAGAPRPPPSSPQGSAPAGEK